MEKLFSDTVKEDLAKAVSEADRQAFIAEAKKAFARAGYDAKVTSRGTRVAGFLEKNRSEVNFVVEPAKYIGNRRKVEDILIDFGSIRATLKEESRLHFRDGNCWVTLSRDATSDLLDILGKHKGYRIITKSCMDGVLKDNSKTRNVLGFEYNSSTKMWQLASLLFGKASGYGALVSYQTPPKEYITKIVTQMDNTPDVKEAMNVLEDSWKRVYLYLWDSETKGYLDLVLNDEAIMGGHSRSEYLAREKALQGFPKCVQIFY